MDWVNSCEVGCGLRSPAMAVSHCTGLGGTERLSSPGLALKTRNIPGELPVFGLHWKPEVGSHIGEGMPQQQDR